MRKHITHSNNRQLEKKIREQAPLFNKENDYYSSNKSERKTLIKMKKQKKVTDNRNEKTAKNFKDQVRSEINKTNYSSGDSTNFYKYRFCLQSVPHNVRTDIFETTDTFLSQPHSASYANIHKEPSYDNGNLCTNFGNSNMQGNIQPYSVSQKIYSIMI